MPLGGEPATLRFRLEVPRVCYSLHLIALGWAGATLALSGGITPIKKTPFAPQL